MQVAAYTDGRGSVSLHDCLLLQHVFWQKPDEAGRIADFVLSQLASDEKSLTQADYIFKGAWNVQRMAPLKACAPCCIIVGIVAGMFARACQITSTGGTTAELQNEVGEMRKMLIGRLASIYSSLQGDTSSMSVSIWSGEEEAEAVSAAIAPKLARAKEDVERLLFEVVTLEVRRAPAQQSQHFACPTLLLLWAPLGAGAATP